MLCFLLPGGGGSLLRMFFGGLGGGGGGGGGGAGNHCGVLCWETPVRKSIIVPCMLAPKP